MKCKRMLALLLTTALILVTCTGAFAAPPEGEERKEETVYVIADASGTPSSILVSTWLQNPTGAGTLSDRSSLSDLEVLKGTPRTPWTKMAPFSGRLAVRMCITGAAQRSRYRWS